MAIIRKQSLFDMHDRLNTRLLILMLGWEWCRGSLH